MDSQKLLVFSFLNYKKYLISSLENNGLAARGNRSALAKAVKVQSAYLSRVLNGDADLSLEQAELANDFFGHGDTESRFFIFLVEFGRAGTARLKSHFRREMQLILDQRERVKSSLEEDAKTVFNEIDQAIYYSSWQYSAVHISLSIPHLQTKEALSQSLGISINQVSHILEFLLKTKMAREKKGRYEIGTRWIHLSRHSPFVGRHHANWRLEAIRSSDRVVGSDFHYTRVLSVSEVDIEKVIQLLTGALEQCNLIVQPSKEEKLKCLSIDFFQPGQS